MATPRDGDQSLLDQPIEVSPAVAETEEPTSEAIEAPRTQLVDDGSGEPFSFTRAPGQLHRWYWVLGARGNIWVYGQPTTQEKKDKGEQCPSLDAMRTYQQSDSFKRGDTPPHVKSRTKRFLEPGDLGFIRKGTTEVVKVRCRQLPYSDRSELADAA